MSDLAALTAYTNNEFAMFTKGQERVIIRGDINHVDINKESALELKNDGYKWSGHTHPGNDKVVLVPSEGDYEILRMFGQKRSVICNSSGAYDVFGKE